MTTAHAINYTRNQFTAGCAGRVGSTVARHHDQPALELCLSRRMVIACSPQPTHGA